MADNLHDLALIIKSRFPLVVVETNEERRMLELIEKASTLEGWACFTWTIADGLRRMAETAVLNANYLLHRIKDHYEVPYPERPMHECVVSDKYQLEHGVKALDIAKRLIDYGYHPPTIYFPLIVKGALMIEPTESEGKERLDRLAEALIQIAEEAETEPETVLRAPTKTVVSRLNETKAAREPNYRWKGR